MEGIILAPSARRMFTYDITHYTRQIFQSSSGEERGAMSKTALLLFNLINQIVLTRGKYF